MKSNDSAQTVRLLLMPLRQEQDVVNCRTCARTIAAALRFDTQDQIRIATAVSEIARNAFRYAREGRCEFSVATKPSGIPGRVSQAMIVIIRDAGTGIENLEKVLTGAYQSTTGMVMGLRGAKRLMDRVDIQTGPSGTTVELVKQFPYGASFTSPQLQAIVDTISRSAPVDPLDELAAQNRELILALEEVVSQRETVERVNEELSETNRGVVALYDELDTVYRVGRVVASKLDLESLLQAITDATTEVSGAEIGGFFYNDAAGEPLACHTTAGPLRQALESAGLRTVSQLLGDAGVDTEIVRISDLAVHPGPSPLGTDVPIRSYLAVPVRDSAGELGGALVFGHREPGAFTERTERILTSVAVQASIGLENARLYRNVQAASAAKDHFLAVLSHELRTPLNPVFAILASLESNPEIPEEAQGELEVMRRNLQLEARLIDDLLDLTKIVKGKVPLHREVTDVHSLIAAVRDICLPAIAKKGVEVVLDLKADQHYVAADAARLQQVLWNLLSNAVKFTPERGQVTITTRRFDEQTICINVADTGRGIEEDALKKIFRPFEQGDAAVASQFGGLGLGLAISKSIVDAHGGQIHAESSGVDRGATFVVSLPVAETPSPEARLRVPRPLPEKTRKLRILLVDDHEDTRNALERLLSRRGHAVASVCCCADAREAAARQPFDIIISDLGLPDGSGHDLMRQLRSQYAFPGIALSGFGMESDIIRSHEAGFFAHLIKPLDFHALEATIAQAVEPR